jgi:predicted TIM-barrel fold metal-dependent hydrolase
VILATDTDPEDVDRPEISDMLQAAYDKSTRSRIMPFENLKKHIKENLRSTTHVSNQDVADWISDYPDKLTGFGSVNLSKDRLYVEKKLERLLELGMQGINLLPHFQFFNPSQNKNMNLLLEFCSDTQMIILSHSGCGHGPFEILELCRNAHPELWEPWLKKYPDVFLVMAHFGGFTTRIPGIWLYEAMQLGKKYKNVYADLSSVGWILNRDCVINEIRKTIGFDRVLFATGYPKPLISAMTIASMVSAIKTNLHLTEKEKRKVLGENAAKLLGIC